MILFDNGPPDGDYVRYIDALMARRAAALVAATMTPDDGTVERKRRAGGGRDAMTAPAFKPSDERERDALLATKANPNTNTDTNAGARVPEAPYASTQASVDAARGGAGLAPTAANAIASAMMMRGEDGRPTPIASTIALVAGAGLIVMGILGSTSNLLFIVAGIALVSWATKRLGKAIAPRAESPAADGFETGTMRRTLSRVKKD